MKNTAIFLIVGMAALITSCVSGGRSVGDSTQEAIVDVDAEKAYQLLSGQDDIIVIDVRTPAEFSAAHIKGAVNIDVTSDKFEEQVAALDRGNYYLVHCAAGAVNGRSRRSVAMMDKLGFSKIYHLNGGFMAWQQVGH